MADPGVAGLLLAAGAGRRFGGPKALADTGDGPWVLRALSTLRSLDPVLVVTGAAAQEVEDVLPPGTAVVRNPEPETGMGGSLRLGLQALAARPDLLAVLVMLVDLPDVDIRVVDRVAAAAVVHGPSVLARASYGGVPGHPVLLGRDHLAAIAASATGDRGARDHLARGDVVLVECGDLATGLDVDEPPA
ncbi:NTP transferase domain-containing protein [Nakamurella sp. YIM 132087]|uniref:NTP transferase domain-containing protein n=1 Tax=Nakamurella alba TaxID=2665158 RepID=A0A7K1FSU2_9ACTN|nr:NTP transferase domain-containing protein [Nakamurella alba]